MKDTNCKLWQVEEWLRYVADVLLSSWLDQKLTANIKKEEKEEKKNTPWAIPHFIAL